MATTLAGIFGALTRAREHAYARGWRPARQLGAPVISLGNLSVGGSGKTPAVIALARAIAARGRRVDVLTRGYGRSARGLAIATGEGDAARYGDEPLLIAAAAGVPVLVAADRYAAGREGERRFASEVHLLDDGFQHRRLARAFDIVLVPEGDLEDRLLPAGRLREPVAALHRASALVWMGEGAPPAALEAFGAPVFTAAKRPAPLADPPSRALAFCGLARPASFWRTLQELGISPVARVAFRDHHRYTPRDMAGLERRARRAGATSFITTQKDEVNLRGLSGTLPLRVVAVEFHCPRLAALLDLAWEACRL